MSNNRISQDFMKDAAISVVKTTAEIIGSYIPLIHSVTTLVTEIYQLYENAECNKEICSIMMERAKTAEFAMNMMKDKKENEKYYRQKEYYVAFKKFEICLNKIKHFTDKVSKLKDYKKFFNATKVKNEYEKLTAEYDTCMRDLHFTIAIANERAREDDSKKVDETLTHIENYLEKFTHVFEDKFDELAQEISILKTQQNENPSEIRVERINSNELMEPTVHKDTDIRGLKNNPIVKRIYKGIEVACKPIKNSDEYIHRELAIIGKLFLSPNILKFYGISNVDNNEVMVFEWAERASLKDLYDKYDIAWSRKIQIILDICRGISFLRSVNIFHHDIRCENILITKALEPKLANFKYARPTSATTTDLSKQLNEVIRWMAPEQIKRYSNGKKAGYTFNCEMFSFGMLIWEFCYERIPYQKLGLKEIIDHVTNGKRERLSLGKFDKKIQEKFIKIIDRMWQHEPHKRITLSKLFIRLEKLHTTYPANALGLLENGALELTEKDKLIEKDKLPEFNDEFVINDDFSKPLLSLDEGITLHKKKDHAGAWKCFNDNSELGSPLAKYWKGYYLYEGYYVQKDINLANMLFKEAADGFFIYL
ncbi:kinase-like domain-containing protein [Gigaspora rosea]|uniref:Kinase-like domain-containing protein n=1 Tax=Gigaspora rosea TaxID=44941 RepID=A0A397W176_9GLOM|nr:kinase-like domain-containing protein [Gigaspora rosea]